MKLTGNRKLTNYARKIISLRHHALFCNKVKVVVKKRTALLLIGHQAYITFVKRLSSGDGNVLKTHVIVRASF